MKYVHPYKVHQSIHVLCCVLSLGTYLNTIFCVRRIVDVFIHQWRAHCKFMYAHPFINVWHVVNVCMHAYEQAQYSYS